MTQRKGRKRKPREWWVRIYGAEGILGAYKTRTEARNEQEWASEDILKVREVPRPARRSLRQAKEAGALEAFEMATQHYEGSVYDWQQKKRRKDRVDEFMNEWRTAQREGEE